VILFFAMSLLLMPEERAQRIVRYLKRLLFGGKSNSEATTDVQTKDTDTNVEGRISSNKHFGSHLRNRLLQRASPAAREILETLSDAQLVEVYLKNEKQGREHAAKRRAEKEASA
jgi:hypothetical protein